MDTRSRQPRDEEQFALETIEAVESVVSHRWLDAGREPTPDLELKLSGGRTVAVEITMSTDGAARSLCESLDGRRWPRAELACEWWVILSDHSREERGRRRNIKALLGHLMPIFQNLEAQDLEPDEMLRQSRWELAGSDWPDWNSVYVAKCDPSGGDTGGRIRTWVAVGRRGLDRSGGRVGRSGAGENQFPDRARSTARLSEPEVARDRDGQQAGSKATRGGICTGRSAVALSGDRRHHVPRVGRSLGCR